MEPVKQINFIQHYKLKYPFGNWVNLSYEQSCKLSRGEISPPIHIDIKKHLQIIKLKEDFAGFGIILSSPILRAKQTAEILAKEFLNNKPVIETDSLKEVTWDLSTCISKEEYEASKTKGFYDIGDKRIMSFINGTALTPIDEVLMRLQSLEYQLKAFKEQKILCITHSFFIKIAYLYFVENLKTKEKITVESIKFCKAQIDYLRGFQIVL